MNLPESTSSRLKRWFESGFYLFVLNMVNAGFPLAASLLLTRLLSQEDYGSYAYFLAFVLILDVTSLPGVATSMLQATAKGFAGTLRPATRVRLWGSLAGTSFLLAMGAYRAFTGRGDEALLFAAVGLAFPFYFPFYNFLFYLNGISDFRRMAIYQTLHQFLIYLATLSVAWMTSQFHIVLIVHVVSTVVVRALLYRHLVREVPAEAPVEEGYLRFGLGLTLLSLFATVEANLDRIIVGTVFSPAALATFHVGKNFAYEMRKVWNVAYQYMLPSLSRRDRGARFPRRLYLVWVVFVSIVVLFMMVLPWIIRFLYPEEYAEAATVGRWLLFAIVVASPGAITDTFLQSGGRLKALWVVRSAKMVTYLLGLLLLIRPYGIQGIYYATVVAGGVYAVTGIAATVFGLRRKHAAGS